MPWFAPPWGAPKCRLLGIVVTFVLRNAFSPRPHIYPQNRIRRLESVSGAANARLRCVAVIVNGLRAAAAILENQRPNKFPP